MARRLKYTTHGSKLWNTWRGMKERCTNPNHKNYNLYAGKLYSKWADCNAFTEWAINNGYKEGLSIDRIDPTKGYSPDNCQFITKRANTIKGNKERKIKTYKFLGKDLTAKNISDILNVSYAAIHQRLQKYSIDECLVRFKDMRIT